MAIDKNLYLIELVETGRAPVYSSDFETQSEAQKVFSSVWEVEARVNGDGFDGLLSYAEPVLIQFAPAALRAIGAEKCARIVESAIELVAPHLTDEDDWEPVVAKLAEDEKWLDKLSALDDRFYEYPDDLTELLFEFVSRNPATFGEITEEFLEQGEASSDPEPPWWKKLFGRR